MYGKGEEKGWGEGLQVGVMEVRGEGVLCTMLAGGEE